MLDRRGGPAERDPFLHRARPGAAPQAGGAAAQDREKHYVEAGLEKARKSLKRKLRDDDLVTEAAARLVGDNTGKGVSNADLIIEAIFENLEAKQE
ncbi:MAG: 3-hydroxyacyl-CoA dehydrogenase NAD-binding domain-containing protein, partial [Candidatus Krumholzibacteriia bacterium]